MVCKINFTFGDMWKSLESNNRGLQLLKASNGGLFFFFQPIVGTFLGWLLLGEQVGLSFGIGTLLIFIGVLLVIRPKREMRA